MSLGRRHAHRAARPSIPEEASGFALFFWLGPERTMRRRDFEIRFHTVSLSSSCVAGPLPGQKEREISRARELPPEASSHHRRHLTPTAVGAPFPSPDTRCICMVSAPGERKWTLDVLTVCAFLLSVRTLRLFFFVGTPSSL